MEMSSSKSAVGLQSLCTAIQTMNERLTHLYLAHNRLAGIPQIVSTLSVSYIKLLIKHIFLIMVHLLIVNVSYFYYDQYSNSFIIAIWL